MILQMRDTLLVLRTFRGFVKAVIMGAHAHLR
jgi:hypothetical protein